MKIIQSKRTFCLSAGAALLAQAAPAVAATPESGRAGSVDFVDGSAQLVDATGSRAVRKGTVIFAGQSIQTGKDAEVHMVFDDGGYLAVRPFSTVRIDQAKMVGAVDDTLAMTLLRGALRSITGWVGKFDKSSYRLAAATTTIGIRGTDHEVALIEAGEDGIPGVHSWVHEGGTSLRNAQGAIDVEPGQAAYATNDAAPRSHGATPEFLQRRHGRFEARAQAHAARVRDIIENRLRKRGIMKPGESLEDVKARFQARRERLQQAQQRKGEKADKAERHAEQQERRRERLEAARARRHPRGE